MAHRPASSFASEQISVGAWVPANGLVLAAHVVQYPPCEGIPLIRTRDHGVHLRPGFVLAFSLSLAYPVVKGSIHIPLNQILLHIRERVLRFSVVNGENREAVPPGLRYHSVDKYEVRGVGLFQAPIHTVELRWPSLRWHGLSLSVVIDTLPSRYYNLVQAHVGHRHPPTRVPSSSLHPIGTRRTPLEWSLPIFATALGMSILGQCPPIRP